MQELTLYVGLPDENTMRGTHSSTNSPRNSKVPCIPHARPAYNTPSTRNKKFIIIMIIKHEDWQNCIAYINIAMLSGTNSVGRSTRHLLLDTLMTQHCDDPG